MKSSNFNDFAKVAKYVFQKLSLSTDCDDLSIIVNLLILAGPFLGFTALSKNNCKY